LSLPVYHFPFRFIIEGLLTMNPDVSLLIKILIFLIGSIGLPFGIIALIRNAEINKETALYISKTILYWSVFGGITLLLSIILQNYQENLQLKNAIEIGVFLLFVAILLSYDYFIYYQTSEENSNIWVKVLMQNVMYPFLILIGFLMLIMLSSKQLQEGVSVGTGIDNNILFIILVVGTLGLWAFYFAFRHSSVSDSSSSNSQQVPLDISKIRSSIILSGESFQNRSISNASAFSRFFSFSPVAEPFQNPIRPPRRTMADYSMLCVAYPTLSPGESPPNPNSGEIQGTHSLNNLNLILNRGIFSFYQDIYYDTTHAQWLVGTLNTDTGSPQNLGTISLESFLKRLQESMEIANAQSKNKYAVLFLNPRYTESQLNLGKRSQFEGELSKLLNRYQTRVPGAVIGDFRSSNIASEPFEKLNGRILYILGGKTPENKDLLSDLHGMADFTTTKLNPGKNTLAFNTTTEIVPSNVLSRISVGNAGDTTLDNRKRNASSNTTGTPNSQLLMIFPSSTTGDIPYSASEMPHIVYGAQFSVVYPRHLLNEAIYQKQENQTLWNGYGNLPSNSTGTGYIKSMLFSNRQDIVNNAGTSESTCADSGHMNPVADTEFNSFIISNTLNSTNYCNESKKGISESVFNNLRFYVKNQGSGIILRPSVVQYCIGNNNCNLYYLRDKYQIISETQESPGT
jgi:hypothetical protein